ncbi:MAG: GNAT family N-acetyltransferase [Candidatus Pacebacteria bacterium]|nr:GNAT family N-acetyltransferase [Candidatus Paceibacterota bacterium]MBP9839929.1 GNAT family N-acetyltransferase [Candidatus Paceibacterota bacterium]
MQERSPTSSKIEETINFTEEREQGDVKFICKLGDNTVGSIVVTKIGENSYNIGALFVDSSQRNKGIGSNLVKKVNYFLQQNKAQGRLINTIHGDSSVIYENNGWTKGEYKSQGAYGGYEYTYNIDNKSK